MIDLSKQQADLEAMGAIHAPLEHEAFDVRCVKPSDPPGVYFVLGTDNMSERPQGAEEKIQLIFWRGFSNAEAAGVYTDQIGWKVESVTQVNTENGFAFLVPIPLAKAA
jgi:hypothetical protein